MRLSLRRVVKYAMFLLIVIVLNIWITYNVTLWTYAELGGNNKIVRSLKLRQSKPTFHGGDSGFGYDSDNAAQETSDGLIFMKNSFLTSSFFRTQRSAKAVDSDGFMHSVGHENNVRTARGMQRAVPVQQVADDNRDFNYYEQGKQPIRSQTSNKARKLSRLRPYNNSSASRLTDVGDVHVSVKTTLKYHDTRVKLLLKTWYRLASEQIFFFTDGDDVGLSELLGSHLINTNCTTDHSRRALSCKMAVEFDIYLASRKRWFCHVDDDVYVNIPRLVNLLQKYNHKEDWYLGKPSLKHPLEVVDRDNPGMKLAFWFATGGAGFCISRSLALKMAPYAGGGRFMTTAESIRLPDDCTVGYIIESLLKQKLTIIDEFHSHLEPLGLIKLPMLKNQITFSFSEYSNKKNVINVPGFNPQDDPTRLKSLHCFLFPTFRECRGLNVQP